MSECKYCGRQIIGPTIEPQTCRGCHYKISRRFKKSESDSNNLIYRAIGCLSCGKPMSMLDSTDLNFCDECLKLKDICKNCGKTFVSIGTGKCPYCSTKEKISNPESYKSLLKGLFSEEALANNYKELEKNSYNPEPLEKPSVNYEFVNCRECGQEFVPRRSYYHTCHRCFYKSLGSSNNESETGKKNCRVCGQEFHPKKSYYHTCPRCF